MLTLPQLMPSPPAIIRLRAKLPLAMLSRRSRWAIGIPPCEMLPLRPPTDSGTSTAISFGSAARSWLVKLDFAGPACDRDAMSIGAGIVGKVAVAAEEKNGGSRGDDGIRSGGEGRELPLEHDGLSDGVRRKSVMAADG